MAELAQAADVVQAAASREASEAAMASQDLAAQGARSDTHASQIGARDVAFNPVEESQGSSGLGNQQQAQGSGQGSSGLAGGSAGGDSEYESLFDAARGLGYDPGQQNFADDRQFLLHLLNQSQARQQEDYYSQLGRQLVPHVDQFQNYLAQQKPQQQARPEWEAPEFDQNWMHLVQRDQATGVFLAKPGVDPTIATKVNEYDRWLTKYSANPTAAVKPFVEQRVPDLVRQAIQQEMASFRRQQTIDTIVQRNSEWMYQHQNGRPVIGVAGQPVPTAEGARYGQLVANLERGGMGDPVMVDQIARQLLLGELARGQIQSMSGQAPAAQQQAAIASSRAQANVHQSRSPQERAAAAGATEPNSEGMSLAEMLRRDIEAAGFSDADFANPEAFIR